MTAKDIVLALIAKVGTGGGQGYIVEYRGPAIEALSMEGRMTICNMSIEWGAKAGMIAPDETTYAYLKGRPHAPEGEDWDAAVEYWNTLRTDDDAVFDAEVDLDASELTLFVTWGTNPGQGVPLGASVPDPETFAEEADRTAAAKALEYMALQPGVKMRDVHVDTVLPRLLHQRPDRGPARSGRRHQGAGTSPKTCGCSWCRARRGYGCRPSRRAWTSSSRRRAPNGGPPVARCVWA